MGPISLPGLLRARRRLFGRRRNFGNFISLLIKSMEMVTVVRKQTAGRLVAFIPFRAIVVLPATRSEHCWHGTFCHSIEHPKQFLDLWIRFSSYISRSQYCSTPTPFSQPLELYTQHVCRRLMIYSAPLLDHLKLQDVLRACSKKGPDISHLS
jgi:hypothetical protein